MAASNKFRNGLPQPINVGDTITAKFLNSILDHTRTTFNACGPFLNYDKVGGVNTINPVFRQLLQWGEVTSDYGISTKSDYVGTSDVISDITFVKVHPVDTDFEIITKNTPIKIYFSNPYKENTNNDYDASWKKSLNALRQVHAGDHIAYIPFSTRESNRYGMMMFTGNKWGVNYTVDPSKYSEKNILSDASNVIDMTPSLSEDDEESGNTSYISDLCLFSKGYIMMDDTDSDLLKPWIAQKPFQPKVRITNSEAVSEANNGPSDSTTRWKYYGELVEDSIDDNGELTFTDSQYTFEIESAFNRLEVGNENVSRTAGADIFGNGTKWSDLSDADFSGSLLPAPAGAVFETTIIPKNGLYYAAFSYPNKETGACASN